MHTQTAFADIVREEMLHDPGVRRIMSPRRGQVLFSAGALAREVFYIESGLVKLERTSGNGTVIVGIIGSGDICGETALIGEATHIVNATTMEASTALAIPTDVLQRLCDRRADVWRTLVKVVLGRSEEVQRKFVQLCTAEVRERILHQLRALAQLRLSHDQPAIPISQSELASMVGATRETTSTTLNTLAREGVVVLGHRHILLCTPEVAPLARAANHA
jgi:CRP-like cAMP-binding protein